MKKRLMNLGVIIIFYSIIIFGVLLLNVRMSYLNNDNAEMTISMNGESINK